MMNSKINNFGTAFERIFVSLLSIISALFLIYLAIEGPFYLNELRYKTAEVVNNQLVGQDFINLFLMSPLLLTGGIMLLLKKKLAVYLLMMTPLFLIYFILSYTIGWEWSSTKYLGNSESYFFYFLFILIAAVIIMLYSISVFPKNIVSVFKRKGLMIYSVLFSLFLLIFASMWIKEILEVIDTGTSRGYDIAPTAFWLVRVFDLGFSAPLGLLSVYLLWARPNSTYPIQFLFYGFFLTMIIAVNAMGFMMFMKDDPTFLLRDMMVFLILALIIVTGFIYILKNYKVNNS